MTYLFGKEYRMSGTTKPKKTKSLVEKEKNAVVSLPKQVEEVPVVPVVKKKQKMPIRKMSLPNEPLVIDPKDMKLFWENIMRR